jgi:hypothetical protein
MAGLYTYEVNQRVRIKPDGGSGHRPPSESAKGGLGTIAPQQTDDWAGTKLEFEPNTIVTYYVSIDGGITELIATDWLEPARPGGR